MNERQAQEHGYSFAGPTAGKYDRPEREAIWNKNIATAKLIKKTYEGADYVIATGTANSWLGRDYKAIYGNEIFNRLWHEVAYSTTAKRAERYEEAKDKLRKQYEAELAKLDQEHKEDEDFLAWMESLKKVK